MLKEYVDRGSPVRTNGKHLLFGLSRGRACQIVRECAGRAGLGQLISPETGEVRGISPHRLRDAFAVHAVLAFTGGCLTGWGKDPWALARRFGLSKEQVCRYCHESFRVWAGQLGLSADIGPGSEERCRLALQKIQSTASRREEKQLRVEN